MLRQGEQVIFQENVKMLSHGQVVSGGPLILTNTRIIYEKKDAGGLLSSGRVSTQFESVLTNVRNVAVSKPLVQLFSNNVLRIETNDNRSIEFSVRDPDRWNHTIVGAIRNYEQWTSHYDNQKTEQQRSEEDRMKIERREHEMKIAQAGSSNINVSPNINVGKIGDDKIDVRDSVVMKSDLSTNRPPPPPPPGHGQQHPPPPQPQQGSGGMTCTNCQSPIQDGWKVCPNCTHPTDLGNKCGNCSAGVQTGWKACPACGSGLGNHAPTPICPHCQSEVQSGWKACPSCGNRI